MKKRSQEKEDKEQVVAFEGQGSVVNFFDPYPDENETKVNNSDTVDSHSN